MRILIADDDPIASRMLAKMLTEWGYEVTSFADGQEAWNYIKTDDSPNLLILDWVMPGMTGVEICRNARRIKNRPYLYILLLTVKTHKEDIIKGMEAGADDYITKPFYPHELRVRIRAGRRILQLQDEVLSARIDLQTIVTYDPLTGLRNRIALVNAIKKLLEQRKDKSDPLAIALLDIDGFEKILDEKGFMAGDQILKEAGERLRSKLKKIEIIGRYGRERFLAVLYESDMEKASQRAEELKIAISEKPMDTSEGIIPATLSIGITMLGQNENTDTESLISSADKALCKAKKAGGNSVEVHKFGG